MLVIDDVILLLLERNAHPTFCSASLTAAAILSAPHLRSRHAAYPLTGRPSIWLRLAFVRHFGHLSRVSHTVANLGHNPQKSQPFSRLELFFSFNSTPKPTRRNISPTYSSRDHHTHSQRSTSFNTINMPAGKQWGRLIPSHPLCSSRKRASAHVGQWPSTISAVIPWDLQRRARLETL